jgi:uncharacterized protein
MYSRSRQHFPDRLRAVALLGIVLVNSPYLGISASGYTASSIEGSLNTATAFAVMVLLQSKFYLLFSFLFGYSSQFILKDNGSGDRRRFRRRLAALGLLGLVHATFFFVGDILMTYAALGVGLLLLNARSARLVRSWAAVATVTSIILVVGSVLLVLRDPSLGEGDASITALDGALEAGTFIEAALARLSALPSVLVFTLLLQGTMAFAAFCLGLLAGRGALLADPQAGVQSWRTWALVGIGIGAPLQVVAATIQINGIHSGDAGLATIGTLLGFGSAPILTLGYLGLTGLLLARFAGFLGPIEQSGRASLSIYMGESVALSIIFCAYGFGLFGTFGSLGVLLVGVAVWVGLALAAAGWLRRFSQGPLEALVGRWASSSQA